MANRRERRRLQKEGEETLVDLVEARNQTQDFLERNQKKIVGIGFVLVALLAAFVIWKSVIRDPKIKEAKAEIYKAESQFSKDSFALALSNPGGGYPGFLDIIDQYGSTPTGNAARYYAAVCYMKLGDYTEAITHLEKVKPSGSLLASSKFGLLGDAYSENRDFDKAIGMYRKAVTNGENDALKAYNLLKAGMLLEKQGETESALKAYKEIHDKYHTTPYGEDIQKRIAKLES